MANRQLHRRRNKRAAPQSLARADHRRGRRGPALCQRKFRLLARVGRRRTCQYARPCHRRHAPDLGPSRRHLDRPRHRHLTLGFLSQAILTAPRVYFAMADDKLFFPAVAYVSPRTRVPVVAIVLQSAWTMVIAISGRYEQILNYVVAMDFLFFGLTATCLFVLLRCERRLKPEQAAGYRVPGHPLTTAVFIAACWLVVANTIYRYPENSLIG